MFRVYLNYHMTTTDEIQRLPKESETGIAAVREVTRHGAYLTLNEYDNMTGFFFISMGLLLARLEHRKLCTAKAKGGFKNDNG